MYVNTTVYVWWMFLLWSKHLVGSLTWVLFTRISWTTEKLLDTKWITGKLELVLFPCFFKKEGINCVSHYGKISQGFWRGYLWERLSMHIFACAYLFECLEVFFWGFLDFCVEIFPWIISCKFYIREQFLLVFVHHWSHLCCGKQKHDPYIIICSDILQKCFSMWSAWHCISKNELYEKKLSKELKQSFSLVCDVLHILVGHEMSEVSCLSGLWMFAQITE